MTSAQAREILAGYRPHKDSPTDPAFAPAFAQLEQDPELARWFEREQAVDVALRRSLQAIPVPVGLQTRIVANRPRPRARLAWWRQPSILSAAATVLVAVGAWATWLGPLRPETWTTYQDKLIDEVTEPYDLNVKSTDPDQVRRAMAAAGFPSDYSVPRGLHDYPLEGGFMLHLRGHKVAVVCYGSDEMHKPDVWLTVVAKTPLAGAPASSAPELRVSEGNRVASWADAGHFYVLVTRNGPDLKGLF